MKAERRHELQENILANWLTRQIDAVKPYWQTIAGVAIVALIVLIGVRYFRYQSTARKSEGWPEYFQAMSAADVDELEGVGEAYPSAKAGTWALQAAGDQRLVAGTNRLYTNPTGARRDLDKAVDDYLQVLERAKDDMLVSRALFGLARAHEGLYETKKAVARYEELVERFPDATSAKVAKQRLEFLSRPSTAEFIAWFEKQDLTPPRMPLPGSTDTTPPEEALQLPDVDMSLTDPLGIGGPAAGRPDFDAPTPGATEPPGDAEPPTPSTAPTTDDGATPTPDTDPPPAASTEGAAAEPESTGAAPESTGDGETGPESGAEATADPSPPSTDEPAESAPAPDDTPGEAAGPELVPPGTDEPPPEAP